MAVVGSSAGPAAATVSHGLVRYLSVAVAKLRFAIPVDRVIGIAESTLVTPLPFSPPPFEGLVLVMGQVVPQISLATLLQLPALDGGVVVLISDVGGSVGLRVDQVHATLQIDPDQIVMSTSEQRAAAPMIVGWFGEETPACGVLDLDHLTNDTSEMTIAESGAVLLGSEASVQTQDVEETVPETAEPYLMIGCNGEIYAVAIDHLAELLELSSLRALPHQPKWIGGMVDLRGEPILGLSLAVLLGREESETGKLGMMIATPAGRVVLVVEHSFGIERYGPGQIHAMREPVAGIASYLVKPDGDIVGIIDPETLLRPITEDLPTWIPQAHAAEAAAVPARPMEFHQFLTLRVGREALAIPLDRIQRLQASVVLTPLPERDSGFDGMADVGDAVVPVIDLRRILADDDTVVLEPHPPCLLAMVDGGIAGIIVNQVLRIETVPEDQIAAAEDTPLLPVSQILHLHGRLMSVVSLDRLLPKI